MWTMGFDVVHRLSWTARDGHGQSSCDPNVAGDVRFASLDYELELDDAIIE